MDPIMDLSTRLQTCNAANLAQFDRLRRGEASCPFWDAVVLTATDDDQAAAYRLQLAAKVAAHEIPPCHYFVFADPPGPKIGNGGATMFALAQLEAALGARLAASKVLLIHAGGYSKRLPQVSVIGKIFAALPCGTPIYSMLEIKLATYIQFPTRMAPGVFVTCADDIELMDCEGELAFDQPGFTALGHPSSLEIGTTHGVFVLAPEARGIVGATPCHVAPCDRFLHKPSVSTMHGHGAPPHPAEDMVYTDSAFYFDHPTSLRLLAFYREHGPLTCEIDAYGDFLQALGPKATDEYTRNSANVIAAEDSLAATRLKLFQHLKGTPLTVIICDVSKFYHIGTLDEYRFHYCSDPAFRAEMGCTNTAFSVHFFLALFVKGGKLTLDQPCSGSPPGQDAGPPGGDHVTLIHTLVEGPRACVQAGSVVEYSHVANGASVGANCVVSNCALPAGTHVPDGTFLHTVPVVGGFVTMVFGVGECLKDSADISAAPQQLTYCDVPLETALQRLNLSPSHLWPGAKAGKKVSLWAAHLFPMLSSAEESAAHAVQSVRVARGLDAGNAAAPGAAPPKYHNMEGILAIKDLPRLVSGRDALATLIRQAAS